MEDYKTDNAFVSKEDYKNVNQRIHTLTNQTNGHVHVMLPIVTFVGTAQHMDLRLDDGDSLCKPHPIHAIISGNYICNMKNPAISTFSSIDNKTWVRLDPGIPYALQRDELLCFGSNPA